MIAFDFSRLQLVTLFVTALTSSVNARSDDLDIYDKLVASRDPKLKFEGEYQVTRAARSLNIFNRTESPIQNVTKQNLSTRSNSSTIIHSSNVINDKKKSEWLERGPVSSSTIQHENTVTENTIAIESDKSDESRARENVPKERNAKPSVAKKRVQARKGVDQNTNLDIFNHATSEYTKSMEISSVTEAAHTNNRTETSNISISKLDTNSSSHSSDNLDDSINSNYSNTRLTSTNVTVSHAKTTAIYNATTTTPKTSSHIPKPKPTVTTVDGPEVNESRPSSRTKGSSLGMPRKIDYIAPVIITIIALPILGAFIFVLYRRGRDCWDKRHYRRMDFLIDGMYNE